MAGKEPGVNLGELQAAQLIGALECELKRSFGVSSADEAQEKYTGSQCIEPVVKPQAPVVVNANVESTSSLLQALHEIREQNVLLQSQKSELARHAEMQQAPHSRSEATCLQWHADGLVTLLPAQPAAQAVPHAPQLPCLPEVSLRSPTQRREVGAGTIVEQQESGTCGADAGCASEATFIRQALLHLCESGAAVVNEASRLRQQQETLTKQAVSAKEDLVQLLRRGRELQEELSRTQVAAACKVATSTAVGNGLVAVTDCEDSAKLLASCQAVGRQLAELLHAARAEAAESDSPAAGSCAGNAAASSASAASSTRASTAEIAGVGADAVQQAESFRQGAQVARRAQQEDLSRCMANGTSPTHLLIAQLSTAQAARQEAVAARVAEASMQSELAAALGEIAEYRKQQPAVNKTAASQAPDLSWREELATAQLREAALRVEVEDSRRELAEYRWDMLMYEGCHVAGQVEAAQSSSAARPAMDSTGLVLPMPRLAASDRSVSAVASARPNSSRGIGANAAEAEIATRLAHVKNQVVALQEEVAASAATEIELRTEVFVAQSEMRSSCRQDAALAEMQARLDSVTEEEQHSRHISAEARALLASVRSEVPVLREELDSVTSEVTRLNGELDSVRSHEVASQARLIVVSSEEARCLDEVSAANVTAAMLRSEVSTAYLEATQVEARYRGELQTTRDELSSARQALDGATLSSPKVASVCPTPKTPPEKTSGSARTLMLGLRSEDAARTASPDRSQLMAAPEISLNRTPPQGGRAEMWQAEMRQDFRGSSASRGTSLDSSSTSARGASLSTPLVAFGASRNASREALLTQRVRTSHSPPRAAPPLLPGSLPVVLPPAMWRTASPAEQAASAQQISLIGQSARRSSKKSGAPPPSLTPPMSRNAVPFAPWGVAPATPGTVVPGAPAAAAPLPSQVVVSASNVAAGAPVAQQMMSPLPSNFSESPGRQAQERVSPRRRVLSPAVHQPTALMSPSLRSALQAPGAPSAAVTPGASASGTAPASTAAAVGVAAAPGPSNLGSTTTSLSASGATTLAAAESVADVSSFLLGNSVGVQPWEPWGTAGAAPVLGSPGSTLPAALTAQGAMFVKRAELPSQQSSSTDSTAAPSTASLAQWMYTGSSTPSSAQMLAATPPDADAAPAPSAPSLASGED